MRFKVSGVEAFGQVVEIPDNLLAPMEPQLLGRLVDAELGRRRDISRRERIATAVLAGFAHDDRALNYFAANARYAITQADALIAELDKEAPSGKA